MRLGWMGLEVPNVFNSSLGASELLSMGRGGPGPWGRGHGFVTGPRVGPWSPWSPWGEQCEGWPSLPGQPSRYGKMG